MRILVIVTGCLLLAALSRGECVTVTRANPDAPTLHSHSRRIQITALQEGKALANVRVIFYSSNDDVNPKFALTTDKQGIVVAPDLAPGRYRMLAFGPEHESTEVYLDVTDKRGSHTSSFVLDIPPTFLPQKTSDIETALITEHVREFTGHVADASGAFVAGALVQVFRQDSPSEPVAKIKADNQGSFAASLPPGKYVVFISCLGFGKKVIGFEIGPEGEAKDLRVELRVASC